MFETRRNASPVIVLSPHQNQFDPISRTAHDYRSPTTKPIMDRRHYDVALAPEPRDAKKRSRDSIDREVHMEAIGNSLQDRHAPSNGPNGELCLNGSSRDSWNAPDSILMESSSATSATFPGETMSDHTQRQVSDSEPRVKRFFPASQAISPVLDSRNDSQNPLLCEQMTNDYTHAHSQNTKDALLNQLAESGWQSCAAAISDETTKASLQTSCRVVEERYALSNVEILAVNNVCATLFVQAAEGFFVFDHNLANSRKLVGSAGEVDRAIESLCANAYETVPPMDVGLQPSNAAPPTSETQSTLSTPSSYAEATEMPPSLSISCHMALD